VKGLLLRIGEGGVGAAHQQVRVQAIKLPLIEDVVVSKRLAQRHILLGEASAPAPAKAAAGRQIQLGAAQAQAAVGAAAGALALAQVAA
nr:hypothetical protein [Tanacetum cinerariifolium]